MASVLNKYSVNLVKNTTLQLAARLEPQEKDPVPNRLNSAGTGSCSFK